MTRTSESQSRLRKSAIAARRSLSDAERASASATICERVIRSPWFSACDTIACYLSSDDEVDSSAIIDRAWRAKKRIFAPVVATHGAMLFRRLTPDTKLERNVFGLWEPVDGPCIPARQCDVVITPMVVFDGTGHRIGMGSGYFDRCFAFLKHRRRWLRPKLIGLAFTCQRVEKITPNPWDIPVYQVITERS